MTFLQLNIPYQSRSVIAKQCFLNYKCGCGCVWHEQERIGEAVREGWEGNIVEQEKKIWNMGTKGVKCVGEGGQSMSRN